MPSKMTTVFIASSADKHLYNKTSRVDVWTDNGGVICLSLVGQRGALKGYADLTPDECRRVALALLQHADGPDANIDNTFGDLADCVEWAAEDLDEWNKVTIITDEIDSMSYRREAIDRAQEWLRRIDRRGIDDSKPASQRRASRDCACAFCLLGRYDECIVPKPEEAADAAHV